MVKFFRKEGWQLNTNDKALNGIISMIENNNGNCPCQSDHPKCPCDNYLSNNKCCCHLYTQV